MNNCEYFFLKIVPAIGKTPSVTLIHLIWSKKYIYIYIRRYTALRATVFFSSLTISVTSGYNTFNYDLKVKLF